MDLANRQLLWNHQHLYMGQDVTNGSQASNASIGPR